MGIKAGDFEIIENGNVICLDKYPITFTFGELSYKIIIHKDKNVGDNGDSFEFKIDKTKSNSSEIHLYIKDSVSFYSPSPYILGKYEGASLLFSFFVDSLSNVVNPESPVVLNYMWMKVYNVEKYIS